MEATIKKQNYQSGWTITEALKNNQGDQYYNQWYSDQQKIEIKESIDSWMTEQGYAAEDYTLTWTYENGKCTGFILKCTTAPKSDTEKFQLYYSATAENNKTGSGKLKNHFDISNQGALEPDFEYTVPKAKVQKFDITSGDWKSSDTTHYTSDLSDGKVTWLIRASAPAEYYNQDSTASIHITDTLPAGMSLVSVNVGHNANRLSHIQYDDQGGFIVGSNGNLTPSSIKYLGNDDKVITASTNDQSVTVDIPAGMIRYESGYDGYVYLKITAKINDNYLKEHGIDTENGFSCYNYLPNIKKARIRKRTHYCTMQ